MNIMNSPYVGLRSFNIHEAEFFFGREDEINKLLFLIKNSSLITVVGPANCGKSSLVRAGILPRLTEAWHVIECSLTAKPYSQLAKALLADPFLGPASQDYLANTLEVTESLATQLRQNPQTLYQILHKTTLQTRILWFIDSFENIFSDQGNFKEVEDFIELILEVTEHPIHYMTITVLIALRADTLIECASFHNLAQRVEQALFRVHPLSREQLRLVIEKPAQQRGATVSAELVEQLLNDLEKESKQLSLLQDTLRQLWQMAQRENADDILLTLQHYRQIDLPFVPRRRQMTVVKPAKRALATLPPVKAPVSKGEVVLRLIPDPKTRKKVIAYLKHISPKTSPADIAKLIVEPPVVLFKRVSEADAYLIVAELEKRGATACFVPVASKPPKKLLTTTSVKSSTTRSNRITAVRSPAPHEKPSKGLSITGLSLFLLILFVGYFSWKNHWWQEVPAKMRDYVVYLYQNSFNQDSSNSSAGLLTSRGAVQTHSTVGDWYRQVTERGNTYSESPLGLTQFQLGLVHDIGIGTRRNLEKALYWYRQAAENGYRDAQYYLAWMYQEGEGLTQNFEKAVYWYQRAAEQGHISAHYCLGRLYDREASSVFKEDDQKAAAWYRQAMELGHEQARKQLLRLYRQGLVRPLTYDEISTWRLRAIEQGEPLAQFKLGRWYEEGEGVSQNSREAVRWYRLAAEQGDANAQFFLAQSYTKGQYLPQDPAQALKWYRQAAMQGHPAAQNFLGAASDTAQPPRLEEAIKWYYQAAEQGYTEAFYQLAKHYNEGQGVKQNSDIAFQWYRKAARQQHISAQLYLADQYLQGIKVQQSDKEAFKWYQLAAQQGSAEGQFYLGKLYQAGRGVERNYQQAIVWYRKAAEQNSGIAQFRLGEMYETGQGIHTDKKKAVEWYRRAVHQGVAEAQSNLAKLMASQ